jgi:hypothetical protein
MLIETDRAYRPSKTMRRVIVNAWGPEASNYAGRRLTLYRESTIKFGGQTVGGIRISHMSHIDGRVEVQAQVTRGKREKFTVEPLPDAPPAPPDAITPEQLSRLGKALTNLSMDKGSALAFYESTTGRVVDSSKALTRGEASAVIDGLEALAGAAS